MKKYIIYIFLLSVLHSVLFYNRLFALNVLLFIIPLLVFLILLLKQNDKIKNKKGLLFLIPILLISISYFIYDNAFIKTFNILAIPGLIIMMYIYTINPTYKIAKFINDGLYLVFEPLNCIGKFYNLVGDCINKILKVSETSKKKIKSVLIIAPIIIVVLLLLSSADMVFSNVFSNFFNLFKNINIDHIVGRLIRGIILFTYLGAVINYILYSYKEKNEDKKESFKVDNYTIKLLLTSLNIIYIVFDIIQIKSLVLHQVSTNINYAQYAREGFFQLMAISFINLVILLISKHAKEDTKYNKSMSIIMVILTLIIIASSAFRMHMYESAFGYTLLRLLVYVSLGTEIILLIPTVAYIINNNVNIFKYYMIIIVTVYTLLTLTPLDYIIANNNINRYYDKQKIDIEYLENYNCDNVPLLTELYYKTDDQKLKENIANYLKTNDFYRVRDFKEYNLSKVKAKEEIKDLVRKVFM